MSLSQLIPTKRKQEDVKDIIRALVSLDLYTLAKELQDLFKKFLSNCEVVCDILNTPKMLSEEEQETENQKKLKRNQDKHPILISLINPIQQNIVKIEKVEWELDILK